MQLSPITVEVRLVPMLVPITTGIPLKSVTKLFICNIIRNYGQYQDTLKDTCSTVIVSEATMATTREVVAEEDCSSDVAKIPMDSLDVDVDSDDGDVDDGGHDGDVDDGSDDVEVVAEEGCSRDVVKIPMASLDNAMVMILMVVKKRN